MPDLRGCRRPWRRHCCPFKWRACALASSMGGRMLLADEMGVGKTVQAIALASCYQVLP